MTTRFIVSPPGWGSDCYRHWEALMLGAVPVVLPTTVSQTALRRGPILMLEDYSLASEATLWRVYESIAGGLSPVGAPSELGKFSLQLVTREYWLRQIFAAASGAIATEKSRLAIRLHGSTKGLGFSEQVGHAETGADLCGCGCQCGLCGPMDPDLLMQRYWVPSPCEPD